MHASASALTVSRPHGLSGVFIAVVAVCCFCLRSPHRAFGQALDAPPSATHRASSAAPATADSDGTRARTPMPACSTPSTSSTTGPDSEPALLESQSDAAFKGPARANPQGSASLGYYPGHPGSDSVSGAAHAPLARKTSAGLGITDILR
jgi:hypothetical protein